MFHTIIYQPLFNALVVLYETVAISDLGIAIILLTVLVRTLLYPIFHKTAKHQRIAHELQPHIKKIKQKHEKDREAQTRAIMELYKKSGVNPLTPLLLLLVQLPILFALYRIFREGFSEEAFALLYSFVTKPEVLKQTFLGVVALNKTNIPLAVLAAALQYVQARLAISRRKGGGQIVDKKAEKTAKAVTFIGPSIALIILTKFPAAVALYWLTSTIFSIIQQAIVNKSVNLDNGTITGKGAQNGGVDGV